MSDLFSSAGVDVPRATQYSPHGDPYKPHDPERIRDTERELDAKAAAMDTLELTRKDWLEDIRAWMRLRANQLLVAMGPTYFVTPDDARAWFEAQSPPDDMSRNFLGAVFRGSDWIVVGRYQSGTRGSNGNELRKYRRREHCTPEEIARYERRGEV